MPSALRSGGGSVFGSTPGPALGDPLSATYSDLRSGETAMPRGRFPSCAVATTVCFSASMTVRSPETSFVTYTRMAGGGEGGAGAAGGAGAGGADEPDAAGGVGSRLHASDITIGSAAIQASRHPCRRVMAAMITQHASRMRE